MDGSLVGDFRTRKDAVEAAKSLASNGRKRRVSRAATNAAMSAARSAGYDPSLRGILFGPEGETDGIKLVAAPDLYTVTDFRTALVNMIQRFRAAFGNPQLPVFQFRIGTGSGVYAVDEPGFVQIRIAQEAVAASDSHAPIVWRGAAELQARG